MAEYIVDGAEPNNTVLKSVTPNGYEHEKWLPVLGPIIRCKDCRFYEYDIEGWDAVLTEQYGEPPCVCMYPDGNGDYRRMYAEPHDFCSWGEREKVE